MCLGLKTFVSWWWTPGDIGEVVKFLVEITWWRLVLNFMRLTALVEQRSASLQ